MDECGEEISKKGSGTLKLQITIDGRAYAVDVEVLEDEESPQTPSYPRRTTRRTRRPAVARAELGGAWDADGKVCRSPVMGLVIKVNVKPGQTVEAGELILVLEAMKMETNVTAPRAGTVKSVHVKPGDSVQVNQVLVESIKKCTHIGAHGRAAEDPVGTPGRDRRVERNDVQEELKNVPGIRFVDHVAIAVKQGELEGQVKAYEGSGFREIHREEVRGAKIRCARRCSRSARART